MRTTIRARNTNEPLDWGAPAHTLRIVKQDETPTGTKSEFKRVDEVYDKESRKWTLRDSIDKADGPAADAYRDFCFIVRRKFDSNNSGNFVTTIDIKSPILKETLRDVIGDVQNAAWNTTEPKLDPQLLLMFLPALNAHLKELSPPTPDETGAATPYSYLSLLINHLTNEYAETLSSITSLLAHNELTFTLLWAILVPRTIIYSPCPITGEPRAARLIWASIARPSNGPPYWDLQCEYLETSSAGGVRNDQFGNTINDSSKQGTRFGHAPIRLRIPFFGGAARIPNLYAYPLRYHPDRESLMDVLIERGRRWANLAGRHHMHYSGLAFRIRDCDLIRVHVANSRIMVDKVTFRRVNANYPMQQIKETENPDDSDDEGEKSSDPDAVERVAQNKLTDEDLLLASPIVYGFSFADKLWLEFNVNNISPIIWNEAAFSNLVLPLTHKSLIRALVESYSLRATKGYEGSAHFDDFIAGKGRGLVINAFGPPGTGKTMSAEATSEHVRKPLYIVGAGDLGTEPDELDRSLTQIFDIAHTWGAVVLIDEADVFLQERSVHASELKRNALVAVFLRQLEYFSGILFITTNRVTTFDEAFQSRIHIALRFKELEAPARRQIWAAFLGKVGMPATALSEEQWKILAEKRINGRQIKNAVRIAQALAENRGTPVGLEALLEVVGVMEQFEIDLKALSS